jgi:hypothetical protein
LAFHSGREADHSPPSSVEVKKWVELYVHSPNTPSWRGAQLRGTQGAGFTNPTWILLGLNPSFHGKEQVNNCINCGTDVKMDTRQFHGYLFSAAVSTTHSRKET